jgi:cytoskeleton-associated protein 5
LQQKKTQDTVSDSSHGPSSGPAPAVKKLLPTVVGPSKSKAAPPATPSALDTVKYKHTPEDADALAADLMPSNISTDLGNANWKTRLAAVEEMTTWLEDVVEQVDAEVVVRFIAKKGWNEKNFQVGMRESPVFVS